MRPANFGEGSIPQKPKANAQRRREFKREFAKEMRSKATDAERKLWTLLRNKRMAALRFRRQQPIGPYIVDFFCATANLIVELDGSQHGTDENVEHDEQRTQFLNARGYRVLRFTNVHLLKHPEDVLEAIWRAVKESAGPLPEALRASTLPQGEGR